MLWLRDRVALVVGSGTAVEWAASALAEHDARVQRGSSAATECSEIAAAFDAAGNVDVLLHAGMPMTDMAPETMSLPEWRTSHSADIDGRFLYAAEFARRSLAAGRPGAILFLMPSASVEPGRAAALSAHGALDNLVKSLAVEWARDGIRVNAIAAHALGAPQAATAAQIASLGHLAAYLVSDYAAYITGTVTGIHEV